MNYKILITNLLSLIALLLGWWFAQQLWGVYLFSAGSFALAGAVTNWLAIFMLFEKVPLLYGSGVVPARFEDFKSAIKNLIMKQFFNPENISQFLDAEKKGDVDFAPVIEAIDYDALFDRIVEAIISSSFGSLLSMVGGEKALQPLREPVKEKLKKAFMGISQDGAVLDAVKKKFSGSISSQDVVAQIENIVDKRLSELTPQMVKEIVQTMIRRHLGWLVVWGGVFGGVIGVIAKLIQQFL